MLLLLLGTVAAHTAATRKISKSSAVYTVTATAYEAVAGQTDSKPFITADNSRIPRGYGSHTRWLALSRDLLRPWGGPFDFGDKVRVEGISPALDGVYTVHDTMNRRYRHRLDVLAHPREHLNLSRAGVRLRRVGASHAGSTAAHMRTASEPTKALAHRPRKAQPQLAAKRQAAKQLAKQRQPAKTLATNTKRATRTTKQQLQAQRSVALPRHKARAAQQLAASSKRPQQRWSGKLLVARR